MIYFSREPRQRRVLLGGVDLGRIVRIDGRFAVVSAVPGRQRRLDFWDGPPEVAPLSALVDVEPGWRLVKAA